MQSMSSSDMDTKQAEIFLTAQTRKHDGGITTDQARVFQQCWSSERSRIHETLVKSSVWNNELSDIRWRVDIKSRSRRVDEINQSSAVVELQLNNSTTSDLVVVLFSFNHLSHPNLVFHFPEAGRSG